MIEVPSEGVYEITGRGKEVVIIYETEQLAFAARMKMWNATNKEIEKMFPEGIFNW